MATSAPPAPRRVLAPLSGLLLGMFVSMIASTVVSTSLPVIIHDLDGDQGAFTWVVTATLLTTAISTPIWGKLADLVNRKALYQIALVIFVLATAAAGFAQDPATLIAFRAVQGLGAGGLAALSQVLMADIISPRERGRYMGLFGAVMAVATVGGPLLGGVITDAFGWRWNFFVSLPVAVAALIMVQRTLPHASVSARRPKIDYLGIVLLSTAVSLLLIWVTSAGSSFDWWGIETILMVGGALVAAVLFVVVELRVAEPLVPLTLFRDRTFTLSVVASIATGIAMFGASVFLGQYMQMARGATPTEAGLMTIPMIAGLLLSSVGVGALITRYGHWKPYLIVGSILLTAGATLLSTIHYDTDFFLVSVYMFLLGAGVGMTMQNLVLAVQNSAKPSEIGVASSGVTFFRSLGGTVGVSLMGAALATRVTDLFGGAQERIVAALTALGPDGATWAKQLSSGTLPQVSAMPEQLRVIVEDIYAQGISSAFLIAVPFGVISILAVLFLPNRSLSTMTTTERRHASEADLATVSVPGGMDAVTATGSIAIPAQGVPGADGAETRR
ncbi:MFS transporter [Microbacterium sp. EYE_5]|uniref:MDR family MFS transporter n=1 Tax=unclassified Microbacterium TaxID=2609290 RepID=UPI002002EF8C|nr:MULTISPECIES: MDR family MFS transporter [unclassified Microbacterium]MCK6080271.1 MFS transporter [Microbacterium sp. EYE_382]MCK6085542.1 MFS transporter [Microbacterium sp. EYE_384]MCK6122233.1 MFS transporter [Microbacterium sp. EYE_80]MCK6126305.1 MFS transporter [Microbacterium sp. EYE_79]MCK6141226.1 MFS transporter [Microbacterium sp. EYE_39]